MAYHVNEQHSFRGHTACRFKLVVYGANVLFIKVFKGHQGLFPLVDKALGNVHNNLARLIHVLTKKLQTKGQLFWVTAVEDKLRRCYNAVSTLLLYPW